MSDDPKVSVVVLGYRAGPQLASYVEEVAHALESDGQQVSPTWEMVLVANYWPGSVDPTPDVAREIARERNGVKVVALEKSGGMGWDLLSGLAEATGRVVVITDGDGQIDPADLPRAVNLLEESGADLVVARREERHDGVFRLVQSRVYNFLTRLLFPGIGCRDINGKPKAIRRSALARLDLVDGGWFLDAEMLIQAQRAGLRVAELPTAFRVLGHRSSFVGPSAVVEFVLKLAATRLKRAGRRGERT